MQKPDHSEKAKDQSKPREKEPLSPYLVWMDMEMTGLDPDKDAIIEVATVITDQDLNIVAQGPDIVLHQDPSVYEKMDNWNREHHKASGLWDKVVASSITLEQAEQQTLEFIKSHIKKPHTSLLCGNSIWQDRRFILRYMPKIHKFMHYRMIDVSTVKELGRRWYADIFNKREEKKGAHRALDDILESINELKFYRSNFFK